MRRNLLKVDVRHLAVVLELITTARREACADVLSGAGNSAKVARAVAGNSLH